jgi:HlyD family secretion protein
MSQKCGDNDVTQSIRRHLIASLLVAAGLLIGVGGWSFAANLAGAVVASGHFVVGSYVKKVQHPTGGVVGEIRVREGEKVKAGDVVVRLDATTTRANQAIVARRLDEYRARYARLEAERDRLPAIVFPATLASRRIDPEVAAIMYGEDLLFTIRREAVESKKAQLRERVQYEHEIRGMKAQEIAYNDGLIVLDKEIGALNTLREQGAVSDQRLTYYIVRIAVPPREMEKLDGLTLVPGMPAEAFIQTGERSALSYFVKPMMDQINRAFRED